MMKNEPYWIRIASYFSKLFGQSTIGEADSLYRKYYYDLSDPDKIKLKKLVNIFKPIILDEEEAKIFKKVTDCIMGNQVELTDVVDYYLMSGKGFYTGSMTKYEHKPHDKNGTFTTFDGHIYKGKFEYGQFKTGTHTTPDGQKIEYENGL